MRWSTATARRKGREFQKRLRRPLPPIRATETGWTGTARVIFTPGMRKTAHVFLDIAQPFPPLASADTHPKGGDVKQAPGESLSGAVPHEDAGDAHD